MCHLPLNEISAIALFYLLLNLRRWTLLHSHYISLFQILSHPIYTEYVFPHFHYYHFLDLNLQRNSAAKMINVFYSLSKCQPAINMLFYTAP